MPRLRKKKVVVNTLKQLGWPPHVIAKFTEEESDKIIDGNIKAPEGRVTSKYIRYALGYDKSDQPQEESNDHNSI